jgi:uncharacterized BrkB/YihY/UPF0761 family membrane protein
MKVIFNFVDLGGLSILELAKRTARASWRDAVFGQGSRMAFYHFLAIFPALLLLLTLASRLPGMGAESKDAILNLSRQVLPRDASLLFQDTLNELNQQALSPVQIVPAFFGALWAAFNGMWAIVLGLNTAYELQERRPFWKLSATIVGLTIVIGIAGSTAVFLIIFGAKTAGAFSGQVHIFICSRRLCIASIAMGDHHFSSSILVCANLSIRSQFAEPQMALEHAGCIACPSLVDRVYVRSTTLLRARH